MSRTADPRWTARRLRISRRQAQIWATGSFAAFGVAALLLQSYQAIWDRVVFPGYAGPVAGLVAVGSVLFGAYRALPGRTVTRDLRHPDCRLEIVPGDLFDETGSHLVIGFTDLFDTDPADGRIVDPSSVQGQFLHRRYGGDLARLDRDLDVALAGTPVTVVVASGEKPRGKRRRHPIGTVAVLGEARQHYFCVSYSVMSSNLIAQSSADQLWLGLSGLWAAVRAHGRRRPLAMPLIGAALARVDALDHESLLRLVVLSFVAASRERLPTTRLRIVLRPEEFQRVNRQELQAFLDSL